MDWSGFWANVGEGLASNGIFAGLVTAVALAAGWMWRRRRVRRFFGVLPGREAIRIVLPGIEVLKSATLGTAPIREGFSGVAINEMEYRYALALAGAVESRPLARALYAVGALDRMTSRPVVCKIETGPSVSEFRAEAKAGREQHAREQIRRGLRAECVVLVGGPVYNVLTHVVQSEPGSPARTGFLRHDEGGYPVRGVEIREPGGKVQQFRRLEPGGPGAPPGLDRVHEYFVIEMFLWNQTRLFICAGTCSAGTSAALRLLANWRNLERRFGGGPFSLVYQLQLGRVEDREKEPDLEEIQPCYVFPHHL